MSLLQRTPKPAWIAVLLAIGLLAFAACGDDDDEGPAATAAPTATEAPTATAMPAGLAPQPERPATAQEVQEQVFTPIDGVIEFGTRDNFFGKNHFQVSTGQTVTFMVRNTGLNPHTFTIAGVDGQFGTADDFDTGNITGGQDIAALDVTLDVPGTYVFRCEIHPIEMWGEITVAGQ